MIPPPTLTLTAAEYHSDRTRWSNSMLKDFRKSPALAWGKYIGKTIAPKPPTPSMIFGTLVHLMATQPEEVEKQVHVAKKLSGKPTGSRSTDEFKAAQFDHPDKIVVTQKEYQRAEDGLSWMANPKHKSYAAVLAHRLLRGAEGYAEYVHQWTDASGVECKCMADRIVMLEDGPAIIELKTTVEPFPFGFTEEVNRWGYHRQAALYLRGITGLLGEEPSYFWVAVHNQEPYEVVIHPPSDDWLACGRSQLDRDLANLAEALERNPEIAWSSACEEPVESIPKLIPPKRIMKTLNRDAFWN